jgi:hypothetical protein
MHSFPKLCMYIFLSNKYLLYAHSFQNLEVHEGSLVPI